MLITKLKLMFVKNLGFVDKFKQSVVHQISMRLSNIMGSLALFNGVITSTFSFLGNMPYWNKKLAAHASGYAMESDIHFKFLATISSLPGAPSLSSLIIFIISTSLVGSRKKDSCWSLCRTLLLESPSLLILEAKVGPMLTKKSLNPFPISLGFVIFLLFDINWSDFFLPFFILITFFMISQTFLRLF